MRYDADKQPDPQAWLELQESERIDLAIDDGLGSFRVARQSPDGRCHREADLGSSANAIQ
jgi:hypothetical protein